MPRRPVSVSAIGLVLSLVAQVSATPSVGVAVDTANPLPNVIANRLIADGGGVDWTAAAMVLDLDQGSVYNHPTVDSMRPQDFFWSIPGFEILEWDTWVGTVPSGGPGVNDMGPMSAGDLGNFTLSMAGQSISASWGGTGKTETGPTQIANISLTDDAVGTWSIAATFAFLPNQVYLTNPVINGELIWDPLHGDRNFDGFVGIADLNTVLGSWNQNVPAGSAPDPSLDGFVGIDDLNTVLGNWNAGLLPLVPGSHPGEIVSDMDEDGFVGLSDLNIWVSNWNLNVPPGDPRADPSGDGFVGIDDKVTGNWNAGTPPAPAGATPPPPLSTPEPGTLGLLLGSVGLVLLRHRRPVH